MRIDKNIEEEKIFEKNKTSSKYTILIESLRYALGRVVCTRFQSPAKATLTFLTLSNKTKNYIQTQYCIPPFSHIPSPAESRNLLYRRNGDYMTLWWLITSWKACSHALDVVFRWVVLTYLNVGFVWLFVWL